MTSDPPAPERPRDAFVPPVGTRDLEADPLGRDPYRLDGSRPGIAEDCERQGCRTPIWGSDSDPAKGRPRLRILGDRCATTGRVSRIAAVRGSGLRNSRDS